ncbi:MAG: pseudouridine synthase [Clostridium sp.]|nr:pseudouridine synthase [Clostridium sp.]
MRINKLLSNFGICSRKDANRIIEEGRVIVNGELCTKGKWVELEDEILLDGEILKPKEKVYIALNKPRGITCTAAEEVKDNIIDFLNYKDYIFPIGRLDKDSEGLILMTNDGDLANKILESDNFHEKEYIVTVDKDFDEKFIDEMSSGVEILGVKTRPCVVERIDEKTFKIVLTQGLNRQIRRMSKALGYNVETLKRVRILSVLLEGMEVGKWRFLSQMEVESLRNKIEC